MDEKMHGSGNRDALYYDRLSLIRHQLEENGAACVRDIFNQSSLKLLEEAFQWSRDNASENAVVFPPTEHCPGYFYQDINNPDVANSVSPYVDIFQQTPLADFLSGIWQTEPIWFLYEQVLLKEGSSARRTPWHQDCSYLPISGRELAVVWITLDPIQKENSLEFVSGSHKGLIYDGSAFDSEDDTKPIYGDGSMPRLPDIEADRSRWPITSWAVTPGDAVIFHPATLHGGAPTTEGMRRRTLSLRFFGPDAIYRPLPTNGIKSVGIEGDTVWNKLNSSLNPGEPLHQSRLFLQVRPLGNSQYRH